MYLQWREIQFPRLQFVSRRRKERLGESSFQNSEPSPGLVNSKQADHQRVGASERVPARRQGKNVCTVIKASCLCRGLMSFKSSLDPS